MNGHPVGWLESCIRNILRAVDLIAGFYPVGIVVVFLSRNNQRIGDYAAGTVVVVERKQAFRGQKAGLCPQGLTLLKSSVCFQAKAEAVSDPPFLP